MGPDGKGIGFSILPIFSVTNVEIAQSGLVVTVDNLWTNMWITCGLPVDKCG
jgi:hypothetical protein